MTISEKEALLNYLEFGLLDFCQQIDPHVDPDGVGMLYEKAYLLLLDVENTLDMHISLMGTTTLDK